MATQEKKYCLITEGNFKGLICELVGFGNGPVTLALPDCIKHLSPDGLIHSNLDHCHPVVLINSTTELQVVEFRSPIYPEQDNILGVFSSEERAGSAVEQAIKRASSRERLVSIDNYQARQECYYSTTVRLNIDN